MYKDIISVVLGFLLVFAMAYLLGTSILTLIDHKMTDISINMPKINLPKPILNVYLDPNTTKPINPEIGWSVTPPTDVKTSDLSYNAEGQKGGALTYIPSKQYNSHNSSDNKNNIGKRITHLIEAFDNLKTSQNKSIPEKSIQIGGNLATNNDIKEKTYYKDPSQMSKSQLIKFKERAQFSKMNLQDYQNWLSVHQDSELINTIHADNYRKYKMGQLRMSDLLNLE